MPANCGTFEAAFRWLDVNLASTSPPCLPRAAGGRVCPTQLHPALPSSNPPSAIVTKPSLDRRVAPVQPGRPGRRHHPAPAAHRRLSAVPEDVDSPQQLTIGEKDHPNR